MHVTQRLEGDEVGPVGAEKHHEQDAADEGERGEQAPEGGCHQRGDATVRSRVRTDGQAADEVREADAEHQGGQEGSDGGHPVKGVAPLRGRVLRAVLEGDTTDDEAEQHQQQRQVEAGEHRRVPAGESREGGTTSGE